MSGCSSEGGSRDRPGCCPAAGPSSQSAEHYKCGDPETGPPHPRLPAQSAADPSVCHSVRLHHFGPERTGNQNYSFRVEVV